MKKNLILLTIAIVLAVAFFGYKFLYHEHRDVSTEESAFTLTTKELHDQFIQNGSSANTKYADKTIEVQGRVTAIDSSTNAITIDDKLSAILKEKMNSQIKLQSGIKIKGRFVGYDDLLEELKMDQVSILK